MMIKILKKLLKGEIEKKNQIYKKNKKNED
jgi:hypothetical protein